MPHLSTETTTRIEHRADLTVHGAWLTFTFVSYRKHPPSVQAVVEHILKQVEKVDLHVRDNHLLFYKKETRDTLSLWFMIRKEDVPAEFKHLTECFPVEIEGDTAKELTRLIFAAEENPGLAPEERTRQLFDDVDLI